MEGELASSANLLKYYVLDKFCRRSRCIDEFRQFVYFLNYDTLGRRCLRDTKNMMAAYMKCDGKIYKGDDVIQSYLFDNLKNVYVYALVGII